jgi:hypothetical protein
MKRIGRLAVIPLIGSVPVVNLVVLAVASAATVGRLPLASETIK